MRSFNVIAVKNLGEKADVLSKSSTTLGQAEISVGANALNGNLFVKDHMFTYVDRGIRLEIGMVYNSQSAQPWRLNLGKKITDVKDVNMVGSKIALSEEDGAKTTFTYDVARKCYVEVGATNGARTLTYDNEKRKWQGFNPATGARDTYDESLNLTKSVYDDGASIEYHRDEEGKLTAVRTTSGQYIEIEYVGADVKLWHHQDGERKLWVTYAFDEQKKQFKSCIPVSETENYETVYQHESETGLLQHITQSDNTKIEFDYTLVEKKLCSIKDGEGRIHGIRYEPQKVTITDPQNHGTTYHSDSSGRLEKWSDGVHGQSFEYDGLGRVEKTTYADSTYEKFYYDDLSFIKKHEDRNGDATLFKHDKETGALIGIKKESSINAYYYNAKRQLRFEVTPVGGVIEYRYDQAGNRISKKVYLKDTFEFGTDFDAWVKSAGKKQVALTEWQYHSNGLVAKEIRYATIDEYGKGVLDEFAAVEAYEWDSHGNPLKIVKRLDEVSYATTKSDYDGLSRIVESCDPVGRITRHTYSGASHSIASLATGHEEIFRKDKSGRIVKQVERADGVIRETVKLLDSCGRCYALHHPDDSKTYFVYDKQNRKKFEIDAEKRVTEFCYDTNDNITDTKRYAQTIPAVDEAGLQQGKWQPQIAGKSLVERKFYDAESRLRYSMDGEGFVTEYRYDKQGNLTDKIDYEQAIIGPPAAPSKKDRHHRYFYNKDGSKRAELTPIGQVIVYERNKNGGLQEKKKFVTPQDIQGEIDIDKLISSNNDEKDVYVLDARGQCKEHTDAEKIVTRSEYDAGGRLKVTKKGTLVIEKEYDELDRVISESHSTGLEIERQYHPNGKLNYEAKTDRLSSAESQELYLQYNGFDEQTKAVTDKDSIAMLMEKEPKLNMRSRQAFGDIVEKMLGDKKDRLQGMALWKELYYKLISDKYLNKDNAATILDEMERQSYYFSADAEKHEDIAELVRFAYLYSAALKVIILKGSWRTYFFGGKWHLETDKTSIIPDFNTIPHSLYKVKEILSSISAIPTNKDLGELRRVKAILSDVKGILENSLGSKSFWRHDTTTDFYEKTVKTLKPLARDEKKAAIKVDEENIYSSDGLLIATRDIEGYTTHYFYDSLRRPIYIVNKDRSLIAKKYDAYSDHVEEVRYYEKLMSYGDKAALTGGKITPVLLALFDSMKNDDKDIVTKAECDKRQLVKKTTDGEGFVEESSYNAFGELENHTKEIDKEKHVTTTDTFEHDKAGRLVQVIRDADGLAVTESIGYTDALGEEIHTDGNGNKEKHYFDRLHRLVQSVDAHGVESSTEWDALSRVKAETNKLKERTSYDWSADGRKVTKKEPAGTSEVESDAFGNVTLKSRLVGDAPIKIIKEYDDHGRVKTLTDANGEKTTFRYDARGFLEFEDLPNGSTTQYYRDEMGRVLKKVEDIAGLKREVRYLRDSQGRVVDEYDGENVLTKRGYNKRSEEIETIIDPDADGLHLITTKKYDGLGKLRGVTQGDKDVADQYHQSFDVDSLGRCLSECVDPNGLDIKTSNTFDAIGNVTSIIDANGRVGWLYYDALSRERFHVSPEGEVTEKQYDVLGRCVMERNYAKPFKDGDFAKYKLKDLEQKAAELSTVQDRVIHYVYDVNNQPRYKIRLLNESGKPVRGLVEEFAYDSAEREIKRIRFATPIDLSGDKSVKEQLDGQLGTLRSNVKNRVMRRWYNQVSQERFVMEQSGRLTETRYDKSGKKIQVIQKTVDAKLLHDSTTLAEISAAPSINSTEDRITNYVYDKLGRKIFKFSPNGAVKKYDYDKNDRRTSVCRFKERIDINKSYEDLVKLLQELKPDPANDSITSVKYDHAGRIEKMVDPLKHEETFKHDALGNVRTHTDKSGKVWKNEFDRAKRLVREVTPKALVAHVAKQQSGQLALELKEESVSTKKDYYPDGSPKSVTKGEGLAEERLVKLKENSKGALVETEVPKAIVDDPAAVASLTTSPTLQKDIKTTVIYNHLQKEVAKQDESGNWSYIAYDALGRPMFEVDREGAVSQYSYNAFDELECIKQYGTKITINHDDFSKMNFDSDYLTTLLKSDDKIDRTTTFVRDAATGNVSEIVQDEIDYFADDKVGRGKPTTKRRYNAAGKCISEAKLIKPDCWAEKSTWYDKNGLVIAEIDPEQYLTIYERDAQGNIEKRHEYAKPLKNRPDASSPFADLQKEVEALASDKDRHFEFVYKQSDKPISIIQKGAITHKLVIGEDGKPKLEVQPPKDLCKTVEYDAAGNMTAMVHEDGARDEYIYDARGLLIAEVGVAREVFNTDGTSAKLRPVIVHHYNAFGERVATRRLKTGFPDKVSEKDITVEDILNHPENQLDIELLDSRGLVQIKQDAVGNQSCFTHTPTKQTAREYHKLSILHNKGGVAKVCVDEVKKSYDREGRDTLTSILRDSVVSQQTHKLYSAFGECFFEGPDGYFWPLYREFDKIGRVIRTNEHEGINTIKLGDLCGFDTLQLQAAKDDLRLSSLDKLDELIALDRDRIERTETTRDKRGRPLTMKAPIWHIKNNGLPTRTYEHDRWDNPIMEIDSRGHQTLREYNHESKEIRTVTPEIKAPPLEGGEPIIQRMEILHGYNDRGIYVGMRDGKKHASGVVLNEAGQWTANVDAEGVKVQRRQIDIFGNTLASIDASGRTWRAHYNPLNLPEEMEIVKSEYGRRFSYIYDEARHRAIVRNSLGTYIYNHDPVGNIIERYLPIGQLERRKYEGKNFLMDIAFDDGSHTSWKHDYFGNITSHTDLMSEETTYMRDRKMQVYQEYSIYPKHPVLHRHLEFKPDLTIKKYYTTLSEDVSKNVEREFRCGLVMRTTDHLLGKKEEREYNSEGQAELMKVFQLCNFIIQREDGYILANPSEGILLTATNVELDGMSREVKVVSKFMTSSGAYSLFELNKTFDLADNLHRKHLQLRPAGHSEAFPLRVQELQRNFLHFDNDCMRSIETSVSDDALASGSMESLLEFAYKDGYRASEIHNSGAPVVIEYGAFDPLVKETLLPGVMRTLRDYKPDGAPYWYAEHRSLFDRKERFLVNDINGWQLSDEIKFNDKTKMLAIIRNHQLYNFPIYQEISHCDDAGKLIMSDYFEINQTTGFEAWQACGYHGRRKRYGVGQTYANSRMMIDANQTISGKGNAADEHSESGTAVDEIYVSDAFFDSTPGGHVISKHLLEGTRAKVGLPVMKIKQHSHYFLRNIEGEVLAGYYEQYDYMDKLQPTISFMRSPEPVRLLGRLTPSSTSSQNDPLGWDDAPYPPLAPQLYVTVQGDTFASIARKHFGDEEAVAALARENGYLGDYMLYQPLAAGQMIFLPQYITQKIKSHSARPYQEFVSQMTGSILPFLKMPMPRPKSDSGSFLRILVKVIAVAIVFAVAPYLGGALAGAIIGASGGAIVAGGTAAAVINVGSAAVAGAALDASLQGVAMGLGLQDHFSLSQSLSAGIGVGVNTAIFGAAGQLGQAANAASATAASAATQAAHAGMAATLLRTAEAAVTTQLIEMATGLRSKFDAKAIATQMASTMVAMKMDSKIAEALGDTPATAAVAGGARAVTSSMIGSAVTHTSVNADVVAAQAVGGAVGGSIDSKLQEKWKQQEAASKSSATPSHKATSSPVASHSASTPKPRPLTAHEKHTLAEAEEATHMTVDEPKLDLRGAGRKLAEYRVEKIAQEAAQREAKIHDSTDLVMGMLSEKMHGTLAGGAIDYARQIRQDGRALRYGDSQQRRDAAVDLGVMAAASAVPAVGARVAPVLAATTARLGLFGRGGAESLVILPEKTVRFTELATGASKAEVRALLENSEQLGITHSQVQKVKDLLGGGRMDGVTIKKMQSGDLRVAAERGGRTTGYQRMSFEINPQGQTTKVVQTAFDDSNTLVRQRLGEIKNNLYDVKKWKNKI